MLKVTLGGCGGMLPLPDRWLTCCFIEYMGSAILIDCGEGTQIALREAECKLSHLDMIMFTHFHADHIAGLAGLLLTLGNTGKTNLLTITGPSGLENVVRSLLVIAPELPFPIEFIELDDIQSTFMFRNFEISALPLEHRISCFGYSVTIKRKPVFNPQKADALNIPKTMYKLLHSGDAITLENGTVVTPDMVIDGERKPYKVTYITDTKYFDGLIDFADNSDLLISEGMYGDENMREKMNEKKHMLFSDSANIANKSNSKHLVLTHLSPALTFPNEYIDIAREIFPNTDIGFDGMVTQL